MMGRVRNPGLRWPRVNERGYGGSQSWVKAGLVAGSAAQGSKMVGRCSPAFDDGEQTSVP